MTAEARFARSIASLDAVVAFTAAFFERAGLDAALRPRVDFALEELFTNMVKYGGRAATVGIAMRRHADGVEVSLMDDDAEPFDPARAPDADVGLPIERREPGGLGLHLTRRLVDAVEVAYSAPRRRSTVTFRVTGAGAAAATNGEAHARD